MCLSLSMSVADEADIYSVSFSDLPAVVTERKMAGSVGHKREMLLTYSATHGDLQAAIKRLEQTIVWRRSERIEEVEMLAGRYKYQVCPGRPCYRRFERADRLRIGKAKASFSVSRPTASLSSILSSTGTRHR
jgi:hypothetical protein